VSIHFQLNGRFVSTDAPDSAMLLYVLRDEFGLNGPRFGCGLGECGCCTVILGHSTAIRSCSVPVGTVSGQSITTLEGLGTPEHPSPVQAAFIEEQAAQCGYCTNGMMMQATAFLRQTPHPTEAQIRSEMNFNLCRCATYVRFISAIQKAALKGGV
jgi:nicotinate dehydrogenase subunit A